MFDGWGVWSKERYATLALVLDRRVAVPARVNLELTAFVPPGHQQRLVVSSSHGRLGDARFDETCPSTILELPITTEDLSETGELDLILEVANLVSPNETLGSADRRLLGVAVTGVSVD